MSRSLFLYRYPDAPEGRYIEDTAQKMGECYIDDAVLKDIEDLNPWAELLVYEENGSDTYNVFTCINNSKIDEIRKRIEQAFVRSVKDTAPMLGATEALCDSIVSIRTICNIYFLMRLKIEKYPTDDRVVIQLV